MASLTEPVTHPPRWYLGFVALIGLFAVSGLGLGLVGLYVNDKNAAKQAECFEAFAAKFSTGSKEVRAAQVEVDRVEAAADEAAADRDAAFQDVLTLVISQSKDRAEGLRVFTALTDANALLVQRRDALVDVRKVLKQARIDHPIPDAPDDADDCELSD